MVHFADPMLLGVLNGVVELATGTFRAGRRDDYITKRCEVAFDDTAQCPKWIAFQNKIAGANTDLVSYKQRLFGLLLTGKMVEILFIMHGAGQNGKSTELETIDEILGDYAHAADAGLLVSRDKTRGGDATPEIVALKGKRAIFINETNESDHLNESKVKYLAGDDTLSGRELYESTVNFRPTHKALLRTNHKPKIRGTDLGIWRRIHYVPYLVTIGDGEKVPEFRQKMLVPELSGILNWMLLGLKDYLADGGLKPPTAEYRQEMDSVGRWIDAACEKSGLSPPLGNMTLKAIHEVYAAWAASEQGWTAPKQKLAEELRLHGYESFLSHNVTKFRNIRVNELKADDEEGDGD